MFTGIIESLGKIKDLKKEGNNIRITIESSLLSKLKVDQSIAHNGICLTIEKLNIDSYEIVAINETIEKTNLKNWKIGDLINLERCMKMNARLDGHIVQGHVDETATISKIVEANGSWVFTIATKTPTKLIVEKGSICVNGTSLTAFNVQPHQFNVAIIPYTFENTVFHQLIVNDLVNLEYDIVGKYIQRMLDFN